MICKVPRIVADEATKIMLKGVTWTYAELPDGRWIRFEDLTVAHCEQLAECYKRRAVKKLDKHPEPTRRQAKAIAQLMDRANLYREHYYKLTGQKFNPEDLPFRPEPRT